MAPVQSRVCANHPSEYHNKASWISKLPPHYQNQVLSADSAANLFLDNLVNKRVESEFPPRFSQPVYYLPSHPQSLPQAHLGPPPGLQPPPHLRPPPGFYPPPPPPSSPPPPEPSTPPPLPPGLPPLVPGAPHQWSEFSFRSEPPPSLNSSLFTTQANPQWSTPPLNPLQAPPPWRSHNLSPVLDNSLAWSYQVETNNLRGQYLGYEIDVLDEPDYAAEFEIPDSDPYSPRIYEIDEDNLSEASTIYHVDQPLDLNDYVATTSRTEPPTYDEAVGTASCTETKQIPEPAAAADKSQVPSTVTEEKPRPSPYIKTRPATESSNKGQKSRKKQGRNGKGQSRKSNNKKPAMTSRKAQEPVAEASSAASDLEVSKPVRPDSPASMGPQDFDTVGWTEVRRDNRKKGSMAQKAITNTAASEPAPATTKPTVAIAPALPVPSRTDSPGVPQAKTSVEETIPEVLAAASAESTAAETRRAEGAQLDIQIAPVREEETPAHVQQAHSGPCIVDTERWRQRVFEEMAEKARQAAMAEQEETRRWEASYARRQNEQHAQQLASYSHFRNQSDVVSPQIPITSASVSSQSQQLITPGPGQPVVQQQALNAERRGQCGYFSTCCAHIPWWNQPGLGDQPNGCCCNHAGVNCCLCRPPDRWGPLAPGVFLELVEAVVTTSLPVSRNSGRRSRRRPSFTGDFPIGQSKQPHLHWKSPAPPPPQTQNTSSLPVSSFLPRSPLSLPPRPPVSLPSPPAPRRSLPASTKMSAAEKSPSVTSTVKDAPGPSLPVPAKHAAHRVTPVIPLRFHLPANSQDKVSSEKITRSPAEEGGDMSTKAHQAAPQDELAPSVASLFEHARQTAAAPSLAIQVDPATNDSRPESPKEPDNAQAVELEGLAVDKLRITGAQVEPDLRSPSLYFDAKQQMSSSPAQSSESNNSPPHKSCMKTTPSTPSPPGASPPRSSVRFSDGTSPGNSPDTKIQGLELYVSPTPLRPRVRSGDTSSRSSNRSSEAKGAAAHLQSLWKKSEFADLQIVLTPYPDVNGPPKFQDMTQTTFKVHKSIVSASPFLRHVMEFKNSRDGHVAVINVEAAPYFASAYAFEKALSTLYGMDYVTKETLRRVTLESIGRSEGDETGLHEDSLKIQQIAFALSYASAGAFLAQRDITAKGIDMALDLLAWDTAEYMTAFGMTAYGWILTCTDILTSPAGSPRSVNSKARDIGSRAQADFVHNWADFVSQSAFQFFAQNMLPEFKLYDRAQTTHAPNRIPEPIWTLPGSLLSNPLLENIRFGDMPSYADRRPSRIDILIISGMLISLPYGCFMNLVDILTSHGKLTVGLLREVVERREERRLHALRMYHRHTWAPDEINQHAVDELAYREYVCGEMSEMKDDDATAVTTSVQRISVGLDVPDMTTLIEAHTRNQSSVTMPEPSYSQLKSKSTAATTPQDTANNDPAEEATERGRQRKRRKNKKKKAKTVQADTSATDPADPTDHTDQPPMPSKAYSMDDDSVHFCIVDRSTS